MNKEERLDALMGPGGVAGCSNAQNCEKVCPKKLPLVKSIAEINRAINIHALKRLLFN
jgi:succinate dehydrogenase / fumarate reductase iron-sulfur subunit